MYYLTLHIWLFVCAYIGYRLVGDVDFDDCKAVASKITPVRSYIHLMYPSYTPTSYDVFLYRTPCYIYYILYIQVPGGVGPMTIAMLLRNTVNGTRRTAEAAAAGAK